MERMNVDFNVTNGTIGPMAIASLVIMVIVNHENWFKLFFVVRKWCTGTPPPEEAWQKEVENQLKNVCGKLADQETASQTAQEKNSGVHQEILAELKQLNTNFSQFTEAINQLNTNFSQFTEAINQLNTNFTTANAAREDAVAPARHEHKLISSLFKLRRNRPHSDIH
ncbi:hypothetical protein OHC33_006638 [Knufia fluminis]|uniref:Uncharacterized protein n=1 Tax=Knufia fluminis TaxID=191047 RepID=A0AAN8EEA7_9EURO|nr:hypothetical protein OHC33_006638 [Knufia fluminis]